MRIARRVRFHLLFPSLPPRGEFGNSKRIRVVRAPSATFVDRAFLVFVRLGRAHQLRDDGAVRQFDLALSAFEEPSAAVLDDCEYVLTGGLNKLQAAKQFLEATILGRYEGFVFLDDDVATTYSGMNALLSYCASHRFAMAQPSLTKESFVSHPHLASRATGGWREVPFVEVMCPYFSRDALVRVLPTFDWSVSTWGVDIVWAAMLDEAPVVVEEVSVTHTKPVRPGEGRFYTYLSGLGISPTGELRALRRVADRMREKRRREAGSR